MVKQIKTDRMDKEGEEVGGGVQPHHNMIFFSKQPQEWKSSHNLFINLFSNATRLKTIFNQKRELSLSGLLKRILIDLWV